MSVTQEGHSGEYYYVVFENGQNEITREVKVSDRSAVVTFSLSWIRPTSAKLIGDEGFVIGEIPIETTTERLTQTVDNGTSI